MINNITKARNHSYWATEQALRENALIMYTCQAVDQLSAQKAVLSILHFQRRIRDGAS